MVPDMAGIWADFLRARARPDTDATGRWEADGGQQAQAYAALPHRVTEFV